MRLDFSSGLVTINLKESPVGIINFGSFSAYFELLSTEFSVHRLKEAIVKMT